MISIDIMSLRGCAHSYDGVFYGYEIFLVSINVSFSLTDKTIGTVYVPEGHTDKQDSRFFSMFDW
jgi:hypothetical protein